MDDFWQAVDEFDRLTAPQPQDPAVVIMTAATAERLTQAAGPIEGWRVRIEVEIDPLVPANGILVVPHAQLALYRRGRAQGAAPAMAAHLAATVAHHGQLEDDQDKVRDPAAWLQLPAKLVSKHASPPPTPPTSAPQSRRRFPIPR